MRKRTPSRPSGEKKRLQKPGENNNRRRDLSGTPALRRAAMSFLLPSATADADAATTVDILAGIRRRKGGRKRRRGVPAAAAGIVVLFSALCAALLWVGVGSFSPRQASTGAGSTSTRGRGPSEGKTRASAVAPGAATAAAATAGGATTIKDEPPAASRNLARRPELKTRGGQLAFARFSLLAEYPHDPTAFTQGLCFDGGYLYESTGLFGGKSTVRKVDTETGKVLQSVKLEDKFFGEGMVIVDNTIHSLTWRSGIGFSWDLETFERRGQFDIKTKTGQGWGITSDGSSLIVSDGSEYLFFWDPVTMKETRRVEVTHDGGKPLKKLNELEMVKGYVFANVWFDEHLYKIDPVTGQVVDSYNFAELYPKALQKKELSSREAVLNGIAWDPEEDVLYLTGKLWPRMYKVKLREGGEDGGEEVAEGPILDGSSDGNARA